MWSLLFSLLGAILLVPGAIGDLANITTDNGEQPYVLILLLLLTFHSKAVTSTSVLGKATSSWYKLNLDNNSFTTSTSSKASAQSSLSV